MNGEDITPEQWATAPLLDNSNVGRYVWFTWNSNTKQSHPIRIVKIGRTNIHVESHGARPCSLRVEGETGHGSQNGFSISCNTEQHRIKRNERHELNTVVRNALYRHDTPLSVLRDIIKLLEGNPT